MTLFLKITQGSFHQADERFGSTAGRQCTCCALFSATLSVVKNPAYWDFDDINYVVENGDFLYKMLNRDGYLMFSELPKEIKIGDFTFSIEFLDNPKSELINCHSLPGSIIEKSMNPLADGFLLQIDGKCVSVTWNKTHFFLFDSHSRNDQGITSPEGTATLMKFSSKRSLELFIISNFLTKSHGDIAFEIQYIHICKDNKKEASNAYVKACRANKRVRVRLENKLTRFSTFIKEYKCFYFVLKIIYCLKERTRLLKINFYNRNRKFKILTTYAYVTIYKKWAKYANMAFLLTS